MAERGIIFSSAMVRALLAGRKWQTRRLINPQPPSIAAVHKLSGSGYHWFARKPTDREWSVAGPVWAVRQITGQSLPVLKLPYAVGDRLYVREAIRCFADICDDAEIIYLADDRRWQTGPCTGEIPDEGLVSYFKLVDRARKKGSRVASSPSIHMPRWASRITLTVTDVRVQQLQQINHDDAIAEGVVWLEPTDDDRQWAKDRAEEDGTDGSIEGVWTVPGAEAFAKSDVWGSSPQLCYGFLWNTLHTDKGSRWQDNPWVVAVTFGVGLHNIDRGPA